MEDLELAGHDYDRAGGDIRFVCVPFTPGAISLHTRIASATPEERRSALDELAGIGEVLHELLDFEEESENDFMALPTEYQDWIITLISRVLVRIHRDSRLR